MMETLKNFQQSCHGICGKNGLEEREQCVGAHCALLSRAVVWSDVLRFALISVAELLRI